MTDCVSTSLTENSLTYPPASQGPGYRYKKAGVLLTELSPASVVQTDLFSDLAQQERRGALMRTVDHLNQRFGAGTVFCAAEGIEKDWRMRSERKSPCYTTRWEELIVAR